MTEHSHAGRRCVDVHHHFYPPAYYEILRHAGADGLAFPGVRDWTVARAIEAMDGAGVETAILSLSPPGVRGGTVEENRTLARQCNDFAATMRADHPGRFGVFTTVPLPDVDGTLKEIEYGLDVLKADGVSMMTSYGDLWLGDPRLDPVFEELNRRKALVYVHPFVPDCCAGLMDWVPTPLIEFTHDTTRAVCSLLYSGTLSRLPDIRFIFSHAGGTVPMMSGRIANSGSAKAVLDRVPKGVDHELKKLHYDVAIATFRPALAALFEYIPLSQILYGTDYPFSATENSAKGLEAYGLKDDALRAIYRGNAERLIPRLKEAVPA